MSSLTQPQSTDKIIKLVADINNIPEREARLIINYQFKYLKNWNNNPTSPQIYLQYLGKWTITPRQFKASLRNLVKKIRKDPDKLYLKEKFRSLWKLRHKVYNFKKNKKRK